MTQVTQGPTITLQAGAKLNEHALVRFSAGKLANCAIGDNDFLGTLERPTAAADEYVAVRLHNAEGTHLCIAGGAIAKGAIVYTANTGRVNDVASGANRVGIAMSATTAIDELIEVLFD